MSNPGFSSPSWLSPIKGGGAKKPKGKGIKIIITRIEALNSKDLQT
jgi:hypothetical protein